MQRMIHFRLDDVDSLMDEKNERMSQLVRRKFYKITGAKL
jgi:hypothetical protein